MPYHRNEEYILRTFRIDDVYNVKVELSATIKLRTCAVERYVWKTQLQKIPTCSSVRLGGLRTSLVSD